MNIRIRPFLVPVRMITSGMIIYAPVKLSEFVWLMSVVITAYTLLYKANIQRYIPKAEYVFGIYLIL
jgi:hypothetical protein